MAVPRPDQRLLRRVAAVVCAVGLGFRGASAVALGSCHDSGGFFAGYFSGTHVVLYGVGVVLLSSAAGLLARTVTRRPLVVTGAAGSATLLLLVLIVAAESTRST